MSKKLLPNECHVWYVPLKSSSHALTIFQQSLSLDECARALRFKFERDRLRFVLARAGLRFILADYVRCPPVHLSFETNAFGKPHLSSKVNAAGIHFNLSHSQDTAMVAIAYNEVGIDIEHMRPLDDALKMAQQFFLADEATALEQLPASAQPLAFFRTWVRKEACFKAIGVGLHNGLDGVRVRVGAQAQMEVWEPLNPQTQVQELRVDPAYACALATNVAVKTVSRFVFEHGQALSSVA